MSSENINPLKIKEQKAAYWSRPGAGETYNKNVTAETGVVKIKNIVEGNIVKKHIRGHILDAGTGSGRFAIELAMNIENKLVALDCSNEMLEICKKNAEIRNIKNIDYVKGDVENMIFPDNYFDSVVSITVVRHFPQWQSILKEYSRVLKPGGKLVFEMCSGNHIQMANKIWSRFGYENGDKSFYNYEAEVTYESLKEYLRSINIEIIDKYTYDFLNNNCFIKILTVNNLGYRAIIKIINLIFKVRVLARFMATLELNIFKKLPVCYSYNYMIIATKVIDCEN